MTTDVIDTTDDMLNQLEAQIVRLPLKAQLKLLARISERLSDTALEPPTKSRDETFVRRGERLRSVASNEDVEKLLAQLDAAAAMWEGALDSSDAAEAIRQMRQEQDEQYD